MDIIAIVSLGRSVEAEAPALALDLGITAYEAAIMLRAALPIVVHRSEDRARTFDLLAKLRARGHDAVACDAEQIASSDDMFRPKTFRIEASELVAQGDAASKREERRLAFADIFALLRATHLVQREETTTTHEKTMSIGRAAMTGGLMTSKTIERDKKQVTSERDPVLYVFRSDGAPWLLNAHTMLYEGLGRNMRVSKAENFEVLLRTLRELAPHAQFDARLLQVRPAAQLVSAGVKHMTTSSAGALDVLAHVVAMALNRTARPYR